VSFLELGLAFVSTVKPNSRKDTNKHCPTLILVFSEPEVKRKVFLIARLFTAALILSPAYLPLLAQQAER
jgi:hypothetical protein